MGHRLSKIYTRTGDSGTTGLGDGWMYKCNKGEETILGILPFFHVYGMTTVLILSVMQQGKMVLLPKFDAEQALKTIDKQKPTLFPGAPTMYIWRLNHPDLQKYDLSTIKACLSGSAPLPKLVLLKWILASRIMIHYNM